MRQANVLPVCLAGAPALAQGVPPARAHDLIGGLGPCYFERHRSETASARVRAE